MTNISTRGSALAVKVETTEGTPVSPTAAGDYIALQDDFTMSPEIESIENAELKSTIGQSAPVSGVESPTASLSHYLRHSGTEATAPNYKEILQALFGSESVRATERDTVSSSTASVIKVGPGEGSEFSRGEALLVKDATNGYSIAVVKSVATDDITPLFNLQSAPASGVNLGRSVTYSPANTHQALSLWHYLGNGGTIQMMSGGRVTAGTFTFTAGQLINANYSLEGLAYYKDVIEIKATNKYIDYNEGGSSSAVTIDEGFYKDPIELAAEIESKMDADATANITVTYDSDTGKFTIASDGATFEIEWNTGTNAANSIGATLGFAVAADDTGATSYESDNAIDLSSPQTPSYDNTSPIVAKSNDVWIGTASENTCFAPSEVVVNVNNERAVKESVCAATGRSGSLIVNRTSSISVTALLNKYNAKEWSRFRNGTTIGFQYNFGVKSAGNWVAGKCGALSAPDARISSFAITDNGGLATLEMELTPFVNSDGEGEIYLSFV